MFFECIRNEVLMQVAYRRFIKKWYQILRHAFPGANGIHLYHGTSPPNLAPPPLSLASWLTRPSPPLILVRGLSPLFNTQPLSLFYRFAYLR